MLSIYVGKALYKILNVVHFFEDNSKFEVQLLPKVSGVCLKHWICKPANGLLSPCRKRN